MTYYEELLQRCPPPLSGSPFGRKQDGYDARLAQARFLSQLMRTQRPFCFLRLPDLRDMLFETQRQGRVIMQHKRNSLSLVAALLVTATVWSAFRSPRLEPAEAAS